MNIDGGRLLATRNKEKEVGGVAKQKKIKTHPVGVDCRVMAIEKGMVEGRGRNTGNALTPTKVYALFRG